MTMKYQIKVQLYGADDVHLGTLDSLRRKEAKGIQTYKRVYFL
jgi:hypothetical protein